MGCPDTGPYMEFNHGNRMTFLPENPFQIKPLRICVEHSTEHPVLQGVNGMPRDSPSCFCTETAVSSQKFPIVFANTTREINVYRIRLDGNAINRAKSGVIAKLDVTSSGPALTVLSIGGEEYLFMATDSDEGVFWNVADIYSSIPSPDTPFYASCETCSNTVIKQVPRMLTMPVSEPHEITCVTSHPNLPYIVVGHKTGTLELYRLKGTKFVRVREAKTLPGMVASMEILPLINSERPEYKKSFLVKIAGVIPAEKPSGQEDDYQLSKPPVTGFLGHWLIRIADGSIETDLVCRHTYEAAWLIKTLARSSLLQVPTENELLGSINSSITRGKTISGCIYKPTSSERDCLPMNPGPFWADESLFWLNESNIEGVSSTGLRFTEEEQSVLDKHVTVVSFSSQIFLCNPSTFNWLSCAPSQSIGLRAYMASIQECFEGYGFCWCAQDDPYYTDLALHRSDTKYVFDKWAYTEDLSLLAVLSREGFVSFLRIGRLSDGTVGMRTEANIILMPMREAPEQLDFDSGVNIYSDSLGNSPTLYVEPTWVCDYEDENARVHGMTSTAIMAKAGTSDMRVSEIQRSFNGYVITFASENSILHITVGLKAACPLLLNQLGTTNNHLWEADKPW